jgi:hypothetical protein
VAAGLSQFGRFDPFIGRQIRYTDFTFRLETILLGCRTMTLANAPFRSLLAAVLAAILAVPGAAQNPAVPKMLNIVIVEGEGAVNNAKQRISREPIVEVTDENNKPVAGAAVVFFLPTSGPGASFPGGANSFTAVTGADGRAAANGLRTNGLQGEYQVRVTASHQGVTASRSFRMVNTAGAAIGTAALWTLIVLGAAGATAGIILGVNSSNGTPTPTRPPVAVTPGTPVVTPPR